MPTSITVNPLLMNLATWGTLFLELAIGILIWNKRCRPYVLCAGVAFHLVILITIAVGFFTPAMLLLYLAFVDPDAIRRSSDSVQKHHRRPSPQPADRRDDYGAGQLLSMPDEPSSSVSIVVAGRANTDRIAMSAGADDEPELPGDEPPSQSPTPAGAPDDDADAETTSLTEFDNLGDAEKVTFVRAELAAKHVADPPTRKAVARHNRETANNDR